MSSILRIKDCQFYILNSKMVFISITCLKLCTICSIIEDVVQRKKLKKECEIYFKQAN